MTYVIGQILCRLSLADLKFNSKSNPNTPTSKCVCVCKQAHTCMYFPYILRHLKIIPDFYHWDIVSIVVSLMICFNIKRKTEIRTAYFSSVWLMYRKMCYLSLHFYYLHYYRYPIPPPHHPLWPRPPCCACPWVTHVWSLASPFIFFLLVFPYPAPLTAVSLFRVSMPLILFCSSVHFVH